MFGAPANVLEKIDKPPDHFEVFQENWDAVRVFVAASTQWVIGFAGATGLNYPSIDFLLKLYRVKKKQEVFEQIQVVEAAALKAIREREETGPKKRGN